MELKVGDKAPNFVSIDTNGTPFDSRNCIGKKPVVLYFYPKDSTSTCTVQACNLRDGFKELEKKGIVVVGVSPDDEKSHLKFIAKNELPFRIIADTDKKLVQDYGVWAEKSMYGKKYMGVIRKTFLIDENGLIFLCRHNCLHHLHFHNICTTN